MRGSGTFAGSTALAAMILLAACNRQPAGEKAATVNDEIISRDSLALEARNSGTGTDDATAQRALLAQVVNRKLLAQEALAQKVQDTPEFKLAEQKARETALVEALMTKLIGDKANPGPAAVKTFIAENPAMFGSREALGLEQIQTSAAAVDAAWLKPANSLTDVARILDEHKVPFERGRANADTAAMPPELLRVLAEHPNEPFAVPQGDKLIISQVVKRQSATVPAEQADMLAAAEIRRRAFQEAAGKAITDARAKAKITYGQDFTPPTP